MLEDQETNTTETGEQNSTETSETSTTETKSAEQDKIDLGVTEIDDAKGEENTEEKSEADARYGAPAEGEAYALEIKDAEGKEIALDKDAVEMVAPALRELNLSNEGASKLVSVFADKVLPHYEKAFADNLEQTIVATRTEWEGAARDLVAGKDGLEAKNAAGEVLSFDGKDLKGVQSIAAKVLDKYAPEGFREFLNETGLGVHPQMISLMYQVGKATAEDREVETTATTKKELSREEKYYGPQG
jgi:hypothetical protein